MLPRSLSTNTGYASTGSLNNQVTLMKASATRTPTGEFVQSNEVFATVWAKVEALAAKYTDREQHVVSEATHKITIRYMPGVTTKYLVKMAGGRIFNIDSVFDPDEKHFELQLFCFERS